MVKGKQAVITKLLQAQ